MSQKLNLPTITSFLKKKNEKLLSTERQTDAYSNLVYKITTDKNKYIYKQYKNKSNENEILKKIKRPKVYENGSNYRIDEYIEHEKVDFERDYLLVAEAICKFHEIEVEKIQCVFELLEVYLKRNECSTIERLYEEIMRKYHEEGKNRKEDKKTENRNQEENTNSLIRTLHMDPQIGNLLKVNNEIILIDYEFVCKGHIAIDLNNIIFESMTNYSEDSILKQERGFSSETIESFVRKYISQSKIEIEYSDLIEEMKRHENLSHFLWYLWGRCYLREGVSECFDYKAFTRNRLEMIEIEEKEILNELLRELDRNSKIKKNIFCEKL